ncbi:MAG: hypothetical protein V4687_16000 [Bacteroidota bacterium]
MKKVNLDFLIKDLDGKDIIGAHAGKTLANNLIGQSKGDALKYWGWAIKLNQKEELELDDSDYSTLKDFVKSNEILPVITKAQILKAFE